VKKENSIVACCPRQATPFENFNNSISSDYPNAKSKLKVFASFFYKLHRRMQDVDSNFFGSLKAAGKKVLFLFDISPGNFIPSFTIRLN
jgi:hypothetical protein